MSDNTISYERTTKTGKKITVKRKKNGTKYTRPAKSYTRKTKTGRLVTINKKAVQGVERPAPKSVNNGNGTVTYTRRTKTGRTVSVTRKLKQ